MLRAELYSFLQICTTVHLGIGVSKLLDKERAHVFACEEVLEHLKRFVQNGKDGRWVTTFREGRAISFRHVEEIGHF